MALYRENIRGVLTSVRGAYQDVLPIIFNIKIHSFIHQAISMAPLQVHYYSEALSTAQILCQSFTPKRH